MSKRKKKGQPPRVVVSSVIAVVFLCAASIGYLWQKTEILNLGREIKKREVKLEKLRRTNDRLSRAYAERVSPARLERRARELNLGLAAPEAGQIVRLPEPAREKTQNWAASENRLRAY